MDQDRAGNVRPNGVVDGFLCGQVAALEVIEFVRLEGRFQDQQFGPASQLHHGIGRTHVTGVDHAFAGRPRDLHRPGGDVVAHGMGPNGQVADLEGEPIRVLAHIERGLEEPGAFAHHDGQVIEAILAAGREVDHERLRGRLAPREPVAQRRDVDPVVGVHVADHQAVQAGGTDRCFEPRRDAAADIEQDRGCGRLDEDARRGGLRDGSGGTRPEDGQAHAGPPLGAPRWRVRRMVA